MERQKRKNTQEPIPKRRCHRCQGAGRAPCEICRGAGQIPQGTDIHGNRQYASCSGCFGSKTMRCGVCHGEGFV